jgi:hypothetical protein
MESRKRFIRVRDSRVNCRGSDSPCRVSASRSANSPSNPILHAQTQLRVSLTLALLILPRDRTLVTLLP